MEKMRHEFIFIFYKKYVLHAIFLLIQDSLFIWEYPGKISLGWKYIFYDHRSSVCMLDSDNAFTE